MTVIRTDMGKQRSEEMAGRAIMQLTDVAMRYMEDVGTVLKEFENTHNDHELATSVEYQTLLAGHHGLEATMEEMNEQLNKMIGNEKIQKSLK